jgi:membrane protease YdiL (CAAX protease family)
MSLRNTVPEPIRRARRTTVVFFLIAHFSLTAIVNLVFFAGNTFRPLASATGGLFTGSLLANLVFIAALVLVIMLGLGRLRLYDVGLVRRNIIPGILYTVGLWAVAQLIHLSAGLMTNGSVTFNSEWLTYGVGFMIGLLLTQIFGNALFEEIAYRGFLFPQLYLKLERLRDRPWKRVFAALLISQTAFALSHIPNRIYLGMSAGDILVDLLMLVGWGILYTLLYLRTDNLFLVVGVHALGNTPTTVFATAPLLTGAGASMLIYLLAVTATFLYPMLRAQQVVLAEAV